MPLLQVRNFPADVYEKIKFDAKLEHRTIAQQTIVLVKRGLGNIEENKERRRRILEEIRKNDIPEELKKLDIVKMIREDRDR